MEIVIKEYRSQHLRTVCKPVRELSEFAMSYLEKGVEKAMMAEMLFLDPDITVTSLAVRLNTNRTYVTRFIHIRYGMTFSELISFLRIEYSKVLLAVYPRKTVGLVAVESGFKYKTQFSKKFRWVTGKRPFEWRHDYLSQKT